MTAMAEHPLAASPASDSADAASRPRTSIWQRRPSRYFMGAFVTGLIVTAALSVTALAVYHHNEKRLLNLRVRELSLVIAATTPTVQTPLATAAELADATNGDPRKFRAFFAPFVNRNNQ